MSYKLYYFNGRGLCEPIRIILTYGGVDFEDIRAPFTGLPAVLPKEFKDKSTWGQVPFIEFEGKKLGQSLAITRYFAKKFNLVGSNDFEAAQCDEYVDAIREFSSSLFSLQFTKDPNELKTKTEETKKTVREKYLDKFSKIIENNGGKWMVGDKMTWADIMLATYLNHGEVTLGLNFIQEYPAIKTMYDGVLNTPQIKKWMDKRPQTKF